MSPRQPFEAFYREHYPKLMRAVTAWTGDGFLAEDTCQEVMLRLRRYYDRYDRPHILMFRMARQQLSRRASVELPTDVGALDVAVVPSATCDVEERIDLIALVRRLPRRQQEVIVLVVMSELSLADTAQVLGISPSAVKTHKRRGLEALGAFLSGTGVGTASEVPAAQATGGGTE